MKDIHLTIDGQAVSGKVGETILEIADTAGIYIPRMCHDEKLKPSGNCRICVVEVEGVRALVGACHTPATDGMVIQTQTEKVKETRKVNIELMLVGHTGSCVNDAAARECGLHQLAADLEAGPPAFSMKRPRYYPAENRSAYVLRNMSQCILCRKCVRVCDEVVGENIYSVAYRGFKTKIVVDNDQPLDKAVCEGCGVCIDVCPTSALLWPEDVEKGTADKATSPGRGKNQTDTSERRSELLPLLEREQRENGYVSSEAIISISNDLGLTQSEVYGVASFYSFLSMEKTGRNTIRICQSLPCDMKESNVVMDSIQLNLGISPGETTADGRFSFELTNCIGACDQAPAMLINDTVYGHLTVEKINDILNSFE